jgi:hypothetical protein
MYYQVASKFVVSGATGTLAYSQAVSLANANAAYVTVQTLGANMGGGATGTAILQIGNDLENWADSSGATAGITSIGGTAFQVTALAAQYARLKFHIAGGSGTLILAADINTASL